MPPKPKLIGKTEYARLCGVHRSRVHAWCGMGLPQHAGLIEPIEADAWRTETLDPKMRRNYRGTPSPAAAVAPAPAVAPSHSPPVEPDMEGIPSLNMARRRDVHWSAVRRQQAAAEFDKTHISMVEVEALVDHVGAVYIQGLQALAGRLAPLIATATGGDTWAVADIIRAEVHAIRTNVAQAFGSLADQAAGKTPAANPEPIESADRSEAAIVATGEAEDTA